MCLDSGAVRELEGDVCVGLLVVELPNESRQETLSLEVRLVRKLLVLVLEYWYWLVRKLLLLLSVLTCRQSSQSPAWASIPLSMAPITRVSLSNSEMSVSQRGGGGGGGWNTAITTR